MKKMICILGIALLVITAVPLYCLMALFCAIEADEREEEENHGAA